VMCLRTVMLKLLNPNIESELKAYCQKWLCHLSQNDFDQALNLVTVPNNYGTRWGEKEIRDAVFDYYGSESEFKIENTDIAFCTPEFMECNDGSYLFGFYFPVNGEITDLTVEFEFSRVNNNEFSATINDIHVL
ncbi:hypothetical protein Q4574_21425, partial [Aliiglaciecola sp. 3_MG-2023]|uniref:hypothetical protein n=2 Tax=Aliiglaciecola TaxID=1406885 RepID=UPI0026E1CEC0